jgi:glycosyl transferase family 87
VTFFYVILLFWNIRWRAYDWDFSVYYSAAFAIRHGQNPYLSSLTPVSRMLRMRTGEIKFADQTPFFLLCFEPFTRMSPAVAHSVWLAINTLALVCTMLLVIREVAPVKRSLLFSLLLLTAWFPPLMDLYIFSQAQLLILLLLIVMMYALRRNHERVAGLMLALAGMLRLFPFAMAGYLIVQRRWRALTWTIGGAIACTVLTIICLGVSRATGFMSEIGFVLSERRLVTRFVIGPANLSMNALVSSPFWYVYGMQMRPAVKLIRYVLIAIADTVVLMTTVKISRQFPSHDDHEWKVFSLWLSTTLMLSPIVWSHYLVLLIVPFFLIAVAADRTHRTTALWAAGVSYILTAIAHTLILLFPREGVSLGEQLIARIQFLPLLFAYLATCWFAADPARAGASPTRALELGV